MAKEITFDNIDFVRASFTNTQTIEGVPFKMNPIAEGIRMDSEMKGGGLGAVLSVAVAIAVPFAAPAIASAIGLGTSVLASAATGAVLGGLGASLTGGNFWQGALMGGIGGGLVQWGGGFGSTNNPLFGQATTSGQASFLPQSMGGAAQAPAPNLTAVAPAPTGADGTVATSGSNYGQPGGYTSATGPNTSPQTIQAVGDGGAGSTLSSTNTTGAASTPGAVPAGSPTPPATEPWYARFTGPSGPAPSQYLTNADGTYALDATGKAVVNPEFTKYVTATNMAKDRMINAAISGGVPAATNLIANYMAQNAQDERMQQYNQQLEQLKKTDQKAYEAKLAEVQNYIQSARNFNPAYFGQMNANQASTQGARRLAESFREMPMAGIRTAGYVEGERRRANLGLSQNVGTAYNQGYGQGMDIQNRMIERGVSMYPTSPGGNYLTGLSNLNNMYNSNAMYNSYGAAGLANAAGRFADQYLVKV